MSQAPITQILKTWLRNDTALSFDIAEATRQKVALEKKIKAINENGNMLTRAFNRWTETPKLNKDLTAKNEFKTHFQQKRQAEAKTCWAQISDIALTQSDALHDVYAEKRKEKESADLRHDKMAALTQIAANTLRSLKRAHGEADEAADMELFDAFSSNTILSVLSHAETDEAVDAIKSAKKDVETLNAALQTEETLISDMAIIDLRNDNNFDLFMDCVSDLIGAFTSLSNRDKLQDAMKSLEKTHNQVTGIHEKLASKTEKLQDVCNTANASVTYTRRAAVNSLALNDADSKLALRQLKAVLKISRQTAQSLKFSR